MAYSEKVIEHYENPKNVGALDASDPEVGTGLVGAPACGDVMRLPDNAFGYVPTPALVAPIEFTLRRDHYERLGGYVSDIRSVEDVLARGGEYHNPRSETAAPAGNPWPPLRQLRRGGE